METSIPFGSSATIYVFSLVVARAAAARKIPRHGAQAQPPAGRRLSHADAAVAAGLMQTSARANQRGQVTVANEVFQNLSRRGIDVERHARRHAPAADNRRRHRQVAVARVRRRADVGLVNRLAFDLANGADVAGAGWHRDQWL